MRAQHFALIYGSASHDDRKKFYRVTFDSQRNGEKRRNVPLSPDSSAFHCGTVDPVRSPCTLVHCHYGSGLLIVQVGITCARTNWISFYPRMFLPFCAANEWQTQFMQLLDLDLDMNATAKSQQSPFIPTP